MPSDIKYMTIEDVSEMLQVTRTTIYNLQKRGLPFIKIGKTLRFDREDVVCWIETHKTVADQKE